MVVVRKWVRVNSVAELCTNSNYNNAIYNHDPLASIHFHSCSLSELTTVKCYKMIKPFLLSLHVY